MALACGACDIEGREETWEFEDNVEAIVLVAETIRVAEIQYQTVVSGEKSRSQMEFSLYNIHNYI